MRTVSYSELDLIVAQAQQNIGDKVTDIIFSEGTLVLGMRESHSWMVFVPGGKFPVFLIDQRNPIGQKKVIKPLYLFLRAHLLGKRLISIERRKGFGRVLDLVFEDRGGKTLSLEVILIPPDGNITAATPDARISLHKPRDIVPVEEKELSAEDRTPQQIFADWLAWKNSVPAAKSQTSTDNGEQKKVRILKSLEENLIKLQNDPSKEIADHLSLTRSLEELPEKWKELILTDQSLDENIEHFYAVVKKNKIKMLGLEKRKSELLSAAPIPAQKNKNGPIKKEVSLLHEARGRTRIISEGITAYIGKSAEDNLQLLRNAKAWHLWVHAKDFPSSHGVIAMNKGVPVGLDVLQQVGQWILEQTLSDKTRASWKGAKCQFIFCECRYVIPIKGDKKGRVTHKNEKSFQLIVG